MGAFNQIQSLAMKAAKAQQAEQERYEREVEHELKVRRGLLDRSEALAKKLHKDPIKGFQLSYSLSDGLQAEPAEVKFSESCGWISCVDDDTAEQDLRAFKPDKAVQAAVSITPLELAVLEYGSVLALKIEVAEGAANLGLNLVA